MDSSDDELEQQRQKEIVVALVAKYYAERFCEKSPCRTSRLQGAEWVSELMTGNPSRIFEMLRMSVHVFKKLELELFSSGLLAPTRYMNVDEQLAIFLFTVSQSAKNRDAQERFQRSGETITR